MLRPGQQVALALATRVARMVINNRHDAPRRDRRSEADAKCTGNLVRPRIKMTRPDEIKLNVGD